MSCLRSRAFTTWTKVSPCCSSQGPEGVCVSECVCLYLSLCECDHRTIDLHPYSLWLAHSVWAEREPSCPISRFVGLHPSLHGRPPLGFIEDTAVSQLWDFETQRLPDAMRAASELGPPDTPQLQKTVPGPLGCGPRGSHLSSSSYWSELPWPRAAVRGEEGLLARGFCLLSRHVASGWVWGCVPH